MGKFEEFSKKFWNVVDKGLSGWSILLMGLMATMVVISVIMRYVFNLTYVWSEELIIYLFVATTYFGSILCVREMEHIDIPFIRDMVSKSLGIIMDIFVSLANIAVQISLAYFSFTWIEKTGSSLTTGLYIPLYIVYSIFPICFFLMAMYTFRRIENKIVPVIRETVKSQTGWKIWNIVLCVIYTAAVAGIIYLYATVPWIEKITTSIRPVMMTQVVVVFTIMFAACIALVTAFAVKRLVCILKNDAIIKAGG